MEEPDPDDHLQQSPWKFAGLNCSSSMQLLDSELENKHQTALHAYCDASKNVISANASIPFAALETYKPLQNAPALIHPLVRSHGASEFHNVAKKFLVFDQSGDEVRLMLWSSNIPVPCCHSTNYSLDVQQYGVELVSPGGDEGVDMHESTEEIDALLYSDSSDDNYDEEEASTGHSPVKTVVYSVSEAENSALPTKRRKSRQDEIDSSITDTASSVFPYDTQKIVTKCVVKDVDIDAESSCVKGGGHNMNDCNKRLKRARIHETMSLLRKIIPGGKGKDTATILDDAICIVKSLQTKANFAATPL